MSALAHLAPRLHKAYTERKEEIRLLEKRWSQLETDRVRLEALVAHRDLQLQRAYHQNSKRYVDTRVKKLANAEKYLANCMKKRAEVDAALRG